MLTKIEINYEKIKFWLVVFAVQAGTFAIGMYTSHTYWIPKYQKNTDLTNINYTTNLANNTNTPQECAK